MAVVDISLDKLLSGATNLIDELYTTEEERQTARLKLVELAHTGALGQLAVNEKEAEHPSVFVSGWRPFIGWVCASALAISFIVLPVLTSIVVYYSAFTGEYVDLSGLPALDWNALGPILMGMLGLGAMRTFEKTQGVARK